MGSVRKVARIRHHIFGQRDFTNVSAEGALVIQVKGQVVAYNNKAINALFQMPDYDKDY